MLYQIGLKKENSISLVILFCLIFFVFSCAQAPVKKEIAGFKEKKPAQIESIHVISDPSDKKTTIEITSSKLVPYAAFKLVQPLRLVMDFNALPTKELISPGVINDRLIKDIHFENIKDRPKSTRVIATLTQDIEYNAKEEDKTVTFLLSPKESVEIIEKQLPSMPAEEEQIAAEKPRLFFSPSKINLNQILGVDFYMLSNGKSRVTITTTKKAEYELTRKNSLTVLLEILGATIPSELTRYLNSSLFKGAVNRITPIVDVTEKQVNLEIELKEMVPYHVMQTDKEIRVDFNKTTIKPPAKKITQARLGKTFVKPVEMPSQTLAKSEEMPPHVVKAAVSDTHTSKYTGEKITLDFAKADVRNILKLIGEVSNLNIVWGPDVKGTVSMRLKNVPWDQALDIVLETNDLGMRRDGNIIWITTKEKIKSIKKEKQEEEALEPLVTEQIQIKFKDSNEIKDYIRLSERGTIKVSGSSIIITDTTSKIEEAKAFIKENDIPKKQIMIEARIVDASTDFTRDLGVQWTSIDRKWKRRRGMDWESTDPTTFSHYKDKYFGGSFSSNAATDWASNMGFSFATLTNKGLGTLGLDAQLALAEAEDKITIISSPKVITTSEKTASIERGDTFYITPAENVEPLEVEAKLRLEVTPVAMPNNYVNLTKLRLEDEGQVSSTSKSGKKLETSLIVKSGDTVVIGGISEEEKVNSEAGIPGLSKIPFLGWLFKTQAKVHKKGELLIFLTPTILTHFSEAQK